MSFLLNPYTSFGSGGSAPAFPSVGSIWAWYEPAREIGYSNGQGIDPLTDQSGNARHWSFSGSDLSLPQYETSVINSLAVANGNHASSLGWDTGPDMSSLTAGHVFAVIKAKADPAGAGGETGLWNFGTDSPDSHIPYTDGNVYDDCLSTVRKSTGNPTTSLASSFVVYEVVSASGEWTRKINGATSGNDHFTTATNTVAGPASPKLMNSVTSNSRHKLAGLYIFSAKLSGGDRTSVIDYINNRFALSSS